MGTSARRGLRKLHVPFLKQEAELFAQRDEVLDASSQLIEALSDEFANIALWMSSTRSTVAAEYRR
jgi:hypothetical protein